MYVSIYVYNKSSSILEKKSVISLNLRVWDDDGENVPEKEKNVRGSRGLEEIC
jgi:hypothetical protein